MGKPSIRFLRTIKRLSKGKRLTEAVAAESLSRWLFQGHGRKYLSLPICEDGIGRPSDARPQRFWCPDTRTEYARWKPFQDHITGDEKGIVADDETELVPFITVDLDRHDAFVSSERHREIAVQIGRHLRKIPHVKWIVEVNPNNGSTKFFGFRRAGDRFQIGEARSLASTIRHELVELGLCHNGNIEVFPDNCKAVFLPLRRDKITIADKGMLPRCDRKIRDVTIYPQRVMEDIRCYSALHFVNWMYQGDNYDEATLMSALRYSCAALPDVSAPERDPSEVSQDFLKARSPAGSEPANNVPTKPVFGATEYDPKEPCAFKRNWAALLEFARPFYRANRRLPSVDEALEHLKRNGLYSGRWIDNQEHRRQRVGDILGKIAETFDPALLHSHQPIKLNHGVRRWSRRHFPNGLVGHHRRINEMTMTTQIQEIRISARFVEHCMGVIAFCLNDHLENKALPVNRIKGVWNLVADAPSWNQTYFQVVRAHLEKIGVINIFDKNHQIGKAWRWEKGENFPAKMKERRSGAAGRKGGLLRSRRPSAAGMRQERGRGIKKEEVHKSLYQLPHHNPEVIVQGGRYRGPPDRIRPNGHFFLFDLLE